MTEALRIGPKSRAILAEIGVTTLDELVDLGVVEAYRRAKLAYPSVTLNFLWGLEAAAVGIDWRDIDESRKRELRRAVRDLF